MSSSDVRRKGKSEAGVKAEGLITVVHSYSGLRVFTNALLKEIHFPLEANLFHPLKWIASIVVSVAVEIE